MRTATDSKPKTITPLPFPVYFLPTVLLAATGLGASVHLAISHYRVYTDMGYRSFCAISQALNCDTVSQSPYSVFLGAPVSIWGVVGYLFVFILLYLAFRKDAGKKRIWPLLFITTLVYSLYSLILALISTVHIHSYCLMCLLTYAVNLSLLFYAWLITRRFGDPGIVAGLKKDVRFLLRKKARSAFLFAPMAICAILIGIFYPAYWALAPPRLPSNVGMGLTRDGHPWIGARTPELTITEYSDYQCFQCKKMYFFTRRLLESHPDKIRLVHRHFPMDHRYNPLVEKPFHVGSGAMALLAIHAAERGNFWRMHDLLFKMVGKRDRIEFTEIAKIMDMKPGELEEALNNPEYKRRLRLDIVSGLKYRLVGTPGFVIDGKAYPGRIPPEALEGVLDWSGSGPVSTVKNE
ncbi:MAG: thioredoxin domain-containing protein [Desulfobacterales bacterium]|nr:thioredoxin domain-containing protein [Desulfobacterales bacterium]